MSKCLTRHKLCRIIYTHFVSMEVRMKKKTMKECFAEIEEMFPYIPEMVRIFQKYEREIRYYNRYDWCACTTKEKLIEKRDIF